MHDEWFASTDPWACNCVICHGRSVNRFTGSKQNFVAQAAAHNTIAITALHRDLTALPIEHRSVLWREKLEQAELAHTELSVYIQRQVPFPRVLQYWLDNTSPRKTVSLSLGARLPASPHRRVPGIATAPMTAAAAGTVPGVLATHLPPAGR